MICRPVPPPPVRSGRAGPTPPAAAKRGNTYANVVKAAAAPAKGGNNNQGGTVIALARALPALNPQRVAQVAAQVDGRRKQQRKAPEFTTAGKSRRQIIATWPAGVTVPALDMQEMYRLSNQHLHENCFAATSILSVEQVTSGYTLHTAGVPCDNKLSSVAITFRDLLHGTAHPRPEIGLPTSTSSPVVIITNIHVINYMYTNSY
ncbi:hypothetical protein BJ165DRAFT_1532987 [Panaeolus papilionaceus]|nr:hypothetical protein BJ165DRAFT_1532987 [Panaeolus papilionaceus]